MIHKAVILKLTRTSNGVIYIVDQLIVTPKYANEEEVDDGGDKQSIAATQVHKERLRLEFLAASVVLAFALLVS